MGIAEATKGIIATTRHVMSTTADASSSRCLRSFHCNDLSTVRFGGRELAAVDQTTFFASCAGYRRGTETLKLWDLTTGTHIRNFGSVCVPAIGPIIDVNVDKTVVVIGRDNGVVQLHQISTGELLRTFVTGHNERNIVTCVKFVDSGSRFLSMDNRGTVKLWNVDTGRCLHSFETGICTGYGQVFLVHDNEKDIFLSFDHISMARLLNAESGERLRSLAVGDSTRTCLCLVDNGRFLHGDAYGSILLRSLSTGTCIRAFNVYEPRTGVSYLDRVGRVSCLAMVGQNKFLSASLYDPYVVLWNVDTGECIRKFFTSGDPFGYDPCAGISVVDETTFLSTTERGTVKLWDMTRRPSIMALILLWKLASKGRAEGRPCPKEAGLSREEQVLQTLVCDVDLPEEIFRRVVSFIE